jgi:hypothetical protein
MDRVETRKDRLMATKEHPWFSRLWAKLREPDEDIMIDFCNQNQSLDAGQWEMKVHRLFMDKTDRPTRWKEITELLLVAGHKAIS